MHINKEQFEKARLDAKEKYEGQIFESVEDSDDAVVYLYGTYNNVIIRSSQRPWLYNVTTIDNLNDGKFKFPQQKELVVSADPDYRVKPSYINFKNMSFPEIRNIVCGKTYMSNFNELGRVTNFENFDNVIIESVERPDIKVCKSIREIEYGEFTFYKPGDITDKYI